MLVAAVVELAVAQVLAQVGHPAGEVGRGDLLEAELLEAGESMRRCGGLAASRSLGRSQSRLARPLKAACVPAGWGPSSNQYHWVCVVVCRPELRASEISPTWAWASGTSRLMSVLLPVPLGPEHKAVLAVEPGQQGGAGSLPGRP